MTTNLREAYKSSRLRLLASEGEWDLVAGVANGRVQHHEYFVIFQGEEDLSGYEGRFEQLNKLKTLGNGYLFDFDEEHPEGVRVEVKTGWDLEEKQASLFLEKLIQVIT